MLERILNNLIDDTFDPTWLMLDKLLRCKVQSQRRLLIGEVSSFHIITVIQSNLRRAQMFPITTDEQGPLRPT